MKNTLGLLANTVDSVWQGYELDAAGKLVVVDEAAKARSEKEFKQAFLEMTREIWDKLEENDISDAADEVAVDETADSAKADLETNPETGEDDETLPEGKNLDAMFDNILKGKSLKEFALHSDDEVVPGEEEGGELDVDGAPVDGVPAEGEEEIDPMAGDDGLGGDPAGDPLGDDGMTAMSPEIGGEPEFGGEVEGGGILSLDDLGLGDLKIPGADFDFKVSGLGGDEMGDMTAAPEGGDEMGAPGEGGEEFGSDEAAPPAEGEEFGDEEAPPAEGEPEEEEGRRPSFESKNKKPAGKKMGVVPAGKPQTRKARPGLPSKN